MSAEFLCELDGVSHDFPQPRGQPLPVLADVTLGIRANEVVALLGPSGCGKSTILRILAGLIRPRKGHVRYHGVELEALNPGAALVFQTFALFPWMTVTQNVEAVLRAAGVPAAEIRERAAKAVHLVGLAGSEEAYPRELSGGMKQRVGMARAFSVSPELLFMDEPFSAVDALTAESLRSEVIELWSDKTTNPSSVVLVSHDIPEVVYMADRIVVLGAHPGRVRKIIDNSLPRPRDYRAPAFLKLVGQLHDVITGSELPDAVAVEAPPGVIEPLPNVLSVEIIGLLEYLAGRGGRDDVFRISTATNRHFGTVISIIKAAEMLELVDTPGKEVILEPIGRELVNAAHPQRKKLWRDQLLKLKLFQVLRDAIERNPDKWISKELVLETIVLAVPWEPYEKMFRTVVDWARAGELFSYDQRKERLSLSLGSAPARNAATGAGR